MGIAKSHVEFRPRHLRFGYRNIYSRVSQLEGKIPDLRFWTFEEAKKEIKVKLKTINTAKSKEDIEHNSTELVRILTTQFNYLKNEVDVLSNNNIGESTVTVEEFNLNF